MFKLMKIVYKHTNKNTGKSYIGCTFRSGCECFLAALEKRWHEHVAAALQKKSKTFFHRAIRKHGTDCWEHEVLEVVSDSINVSKREVFWITKFQTFGKGYNMTPGGEGVVDMLPAEKLKHKLATKAAMADPKLKAEISRKLKIAMNRPETKERQITAQRIAQNRPDVLLKRQLKNSLPETKQKNRMRSLKFHENEQTKEKHRSACDVSNKRLKSNPVFQFSLDGQIVAKHESIIAIQRLGGYPSIFYVLQGRGRSDNLYKNFVWKHQADVEQEMIRINSLSC